MTLVKRRKGWRMSCDVGEVTGRLDNEPFRYLTYVRAHSPTVLSLLLRHRLFTYVTWRASHVALNLSISVYTAQSTLLACGKCDGAIVESLINIIIIKLYLNYDFII